jgi:hypothetical protein
MVKVKKKQRKFFNLRVNLKKTITKINKNKKIKIKLKNFTL